jgi:hypothetical protein
VKSLLFIKVLEQWLEHYTFHPLVKITAESEADKACAADFDEEEAQLPFQSSNVQEQPRRQDGTKRRLFRSGSAFKLYCQFLKTCRMQENPNWWGKMREPIKVFSRE